MNPRGGEQSHLESTPLNAEQLDSGQEGTVEAPVSSPESTAVSEPKAPAMPANPIVIPDQPAPVIALPGGDDSSQLTQSTSVGPVKMEREWLEKAKKIVIETKDDPYKQKSEMSKVKAAYIEKTFNKKIKLDDAVGK